MTGKTHRFPLNGKSLLEVERREDAVRNHRTIVAADEALNAFYGFGWQQGMGASERAKERQAMIRAVENFERIRDGK
ncbi:MAG: hypothetical protein RIC16_03875 [Rhodospirillales bacterium]